MRRAMIEMSKMSGIFTPETLNSPVSLATVFFPGWAYLLTSGAFSFNRRKQDKQKLKLFICNNRIVLFGLIWLIPF